MTYKDRNIEGIKTEVEGWEILLFPDTDEPEYISLALDLDVDPTVYSNEALIYAIKHEHINIFKELIKIYDVRDTLEHLYTWETIGNAPDSDNLAEMASILMSYWNIYDLLGYDLISLFWKVLNSNKPKLLDVIFNSKELNDVTNSPIFTLTLSTAISSLINANKLESISVLLNKLQTIDITNSLKNIIPDPKFWIRALKEHYQILINNKDDETKLSDYWIYHALKTTDILLNNYKNDPVNKFKITHDKLGDMLMESTSPRTRSYTIFKYLITHGAPEFSFGQILAASLAITYNSGGIFRNAVGNIWGLKALQLVSSERLTMRN